MGDDPVDGPTVSCHRDTFFVRNVEALLVHLEHLCNADCAAAAAAFERVAGNRLAGRGTLVIGPWPGSSPFCNRGRRQP